MTAIPHRRKRRTVTAAALGVIAALILPVAVYVSADKLLHSSDGTNVGSENTLSIPSTPAALMVGVNSRNEVAMMAVIALAPGGKGGTVVSFPVGTTAKIPKSGTIHRLADTYATGGLTALQYDVEGTLNVSFSVVATVSAGDLASMLTPLGERTVVLDRPVLEVDGDGESVVIAPAGQQAMTPGQMAEALMASPPGQKEALRLSAQKAVWTAIATGVTTSGPSTTSTTIANQTDPAVPTDMASFFAAFSSGPMQAWQLSSTVITEEARNPQKIDLYALDGAEVIMVMASVAPGAVSLATNNVAFLVDSPFADAKITREAILRLALVGANIVLVREISDQPQAHTVVYYNEDLVRNDVEQYQTYIGPLEFRKTSDTVERVNAHLVLGEDFKSFIGGQGAVIPTTTTSTIE